MADAEFHRQLLENLSTALLVLEPDLRVSFINPAAQALLELSESRTMGSQFEELFPGQTQLLEGLDAVVESHSAYTSRGVTLKLASGQDLTVDCTVTPFADSEAQVARFILELHPMDRIMRINRDEGLISSQETTQAIRRPEPAEAARIQRLM